MISGVPSNSIVDVFGVKFRTGRPEMVHSLAGDGAHVYMQTSQGLFKVGSGYAGTIKVKISLSSLKYYLIISSGKLGFNELVGTELIVRYNRVDLCSKCLI